MKKRPQIYGFLYMGQVQIPPIPNYIVMIDRVTGVNMLLSFSGGSPVMTAGVPATPDYTLYGSRAGPYLNGNIRLFSSSGTLSAELISATDLSVGNARVIARVAGSTTGLEVTAPLTWKAGDALVYTSIEF